MQTLNVSMVAVTSWTNKRAVRIENGRVWLEVARTADDCHLCPTCTARADRTEAFLQSMKVPFDWVVAEGGQWLVIGYTDDEHPLQALANALGLVVDGYRPVKPCPPSTTGTIEVADDAKHIKVHIPPWQRNRHVIVEAERILFQVTLGCNHCLICKMRARTVSEALERSGVTADWGYVQGWDDVRFIAISRPADEEPITYISRVIGVSMQDLSMSAESDGA